MSKGMFNKFEFYHEPTRTTTRFGVKVRVFRVVRGKFYYFLPAMLFWQFATKIVHINDMKNVLETCNIKQLVGDYLYTKFN